MLFCTISKIKLGIPITQIPSETEKIVFGGILREVQGGFDNSSS